ncbi:MAG TPA: hypothetical protein VF506_19240, partial [Streptosporangiaceae bacterium]
FFPRIGVYLGLVLLVNVVPYVAGVFWGAPLASREFETGTQDVVWQQSVTRRRWLAIKVGLIGLIAMAAAALAVVAVSWWSRPLDATAISGISRISPAIFDARGYAVLGHTALAFTLGVTVGLLVRRTLPAMAITFTVLVAIQIVVPTIVRPHYAAPARIETAITADNIAGVTTTADGTARGLLVDAGPARAWILSNRTVNAAGHPVNVLPAWVADCATPDAPAGEVAQGQCLDRLAAAGYRQAVTYHPANRFWLFQAYETVIFTMLSLLLFWFCFLRIAPGPPRAGHRLTGWPRPDVRSC